MLAGPDGAPRTLAALLSGRPLPAKALICPSRLKLLRKAGAVPKASAGGSGRVAKPRPNASAMRPPKGDGTDSIARPKMLAPSPYPDRNRATPFSVTDPRFLLSKAEKAQKLDPPT